METASGPRASSLTKREHEVLELMAFGLTNKEIAQRLSLSPRTVESHIDRVLSKLNASTRTSAVVEAGRAGLLPASSVAPLAEYGRHNLPFQLTPLVGREQDVIDVKERLSRNRLLTLTGSGGIGKTRLALRVGVDLISSYPDGVWFCDFSTISDPGFVARIVARTLHISEHPNHLLVASIAHALERRRALLIFDNCEHQIDPCAELADEILHCCPDVRILATSRQPLGIIGEVVMRVPSLSVPDNTSDLTPDQATNYSAVALFMDRARASDREFAITTKNTGAIADICRRLDGIPLALELAAARVNVFSVHGVAASLDDRFKVLTGGGRTALPRHKTLAALIDWSYDRLPEKERMLFTKLGVFGGSFSLQAVAAICAENNCERNEVLDLVIALVEKSLLVAETGGEEERYRLLESARVYALWKLSDAEREQLSRRHAQYFRDLAVSSDERYGIGSTSAWLHGMELEIGNYRAGLEWALKERHDMALGGALAGALERLWALLGQSVEARTWLDMALECLTEEGHRAIVARLCLAKARFSQGAPMRDCAQRALSLYQTLNDGAGAAHSSRTLAYSLLQMGRADEAEAMIACANAAFREQGDRAGMASCFGLEAVSAYNRGDFSRGRESYLLALAAYRELGDELSTANVLGNLAELEFADGRAERALECVNESLEITSQSKYATDVAILYNNMTAYRIALGQFDDALESAKKALHWAQPERNAWNVAVALQHFALLGGLLGQPTRAAQLLGYVDVQYRSLGLEREATEQSSYEKLLASLNEQLKASDIQALAASGSTWSEDRAVKEALIIDGGCRTP